jgi:hypothetical protein
MERLLAVPRSIVSADLPLSLDGCCADHFARKAPAAERPHRTWGYPVVPAISILLAGLLILDLLAAPTTSGIGILIMLTGVPVYFCGVKPPRLSQSFLASADEPRARKIKKQLMAAGARSPRNGKRSKSSSEAFRGECKIDEQKELRRMAKTKRKKIAEKKRR